MVESFCISPSLNLLIKFVLLQTVVMASRYACILAMPFSGKSTEINDAVGNSRLLQTPAPLQNIRRRVAFVDMGKDIIVSALYPFTPSFP